MKDRRNDDVETRTSWGARLFWMLVGGGIAYAALQDSSEATAARRQELLAQAKHRSEVGLGRATGAVNRMMGRDEPVDAVALRQKIRSEVIGRVDDSGDVIVDVEEGGLVDLKGSVTDQATVDELTARIGAISGVNRITETLQVGGSS